MLDLIVAGLKMIFSAFVIGVWICVVISLNQILRERDYEKDPFYRELRLSHPVLAKSLIIIDYLVIGLLATVMATKLILFINSL